MKSRFPAGELQGDAQIGPAVGLPDFAGSHPDALVLHGQGYLSVPGQALDTSGSYLVSAWVKLNQVVGFQTVAAMEGQSASPFYLQYRDDMHSFVFASLPADASNGSPPAAQWNAGAKAAGFLAPQPNRWYWLVGIQDAGANSIMLYVDGVLQQTVHYQSAWKAAGPLTIGRGFYNGKPDDYLDGEVTDVEVYQGLHPIDPNRMRQAAARAVQIDTAAAAASPATVNLDLAAPEKPSSPTLYGLMIEDINHSIDGGLYAELIQNRDFKDDASKPVHWQAISEGVVNGTILVDNAQTPPYGTKLTSSLKVTQTPPPMFEERADRWGYGVSNEGYWGVPIKPSTTYRVSLYAKAGAGSAGIRLTAILRSSDGSEIYAWSQPVVLTQKWHKYSLTLQTSGQISPIRGGCFAVVNTSNEVHSTFWITQVSLMPPTYKDRSNGARVDLMQKLAAMHPAFLRLPGGNFLEGNHLQDWFNWKKTIGPTENRPGHANPWGYPSTDGFGLLEYLEWCEDLRMEPVLAVYAGYSLSGDYVKPGAALAPYVQDALDEIEYVTGDAKTTKWGAVRAKNGHPAPFPLHYVEVGNEDWFDKSGSYEAGRFAQFFDAIRAKYPKLKIISTTNAVKSRTPDVIDDHNYSYPQAFIRDAGHYDSMSRSGPKTFVGEWASQEGEPTPDMGACLGDSAWMCGLERNSDQIILASYAPLLVNVNDGAGQWGTNLVGFNSLAGYGSPTYYAQAMFAAAHGKTIVPLQITPDSVLIGSATRTQKPGGSSVIYLKLVNPTDAPVPAHIGLRGIASGMTLSSGADVRVLQAASPADTNTIRSPRAIVPVGSQIDGVSTSFTYPAPPYSVTVMALRVSGQK